eukprot:gb/GEZN01002929.1/.p1 GENE.gb/GEZN01002929.1/~~gb/GEZN01002929.1/.p1  ORF type:complete len:718 (+),score=79.08 gb/GEZN01002929.1/:133-2286(+)
MKSKAIGRGGGGGGGGAQEQGRAVERSPDDKHQQLSFSPSSARAPCFLMNTPLEVSISRFLPPPDNDVVAVMYEMHDSSASLAQRDILATKTIRPNRCRRALDWLCCPVLTVYFSLSLYLLSCLSSLCCCLPSCLSYVFSDREFPPSKKSLGEWRDPYTQEPLSQNVEWLRAFVILHTMGRQEQCSPSIVSRHAQPIQRATLPSEPDSADVELTTQEGVFPFEPVGLAAVRESALRQAQTDSLQLPSNQSALVVPVMPSSCPSDHLPVAVSSSVPNRLSGGVFTLLPPRLSPQDIALQPLVFPWLLSALVCLSEFHGSIRQLFAFPLCSASGHHRVRLFDGWSRRFIWLDLDDWLPVHPPSGHPLCQLQRHGQLVPELCPLFQLPRHGKLVVPQLWLWLLVKAFAKFHSTFTALQSLSFAGPVSKDTAGAELVLSALETLTGCQEVMGWSRSPDKRVVDRESPFAHPAPIWDNRPGLGRWSRLVLQHHQTQQRRCSEQQPQNGAVGEVMRRRQVSVDMTGETLCDEELFELMKVHLERGSILGASSVGRPRSDVKMQGRHNGNVQEGHVYSILNLVQYGMYHLLQIRNVWGTFEWRGDWSNSSRRWKENPFVLRRCHNHGVIDTNNGCFWMEWSDFIFYFQLLYIAVRRTDGVRELSLKRAEGIRGTCGVVKACVSGCFSFYCACRGPRALLYPRVSTNTTYQAWKQNHRHQPAAQA